MSNLRQKILDCVSLQKNIKYLTIIFLKYQVQTDTVLGKLVCVQQRSWKQYTAPYSNNSARTSFFYYKEVVSEYLIYSENETQSKIFGLDFFFNRHVASIWRRHRRHTSLWSLWRMHSITMCSDDSKISVLRWWLIFWLLLARAATKKSGTNEAHIFSKEKLKNLPAKWHQNVTHLKFRRRRSAGCRSSFHIAPQPYTDSRSLSLSHSYV